MPITMERSTVPTTPLPSRLSKSADQCQAALSRFVDDGDRERMLAPRSRLAANRSSSSSVTLEAVLTAVTDGLPW